MHAKYREGPVKESAVESAFTRRLTDQGFDGVAIKINIMGRRSWPDRLVVGNKRLFELVEFKRPGEDLREGQGVIHKMLRRWGFAPYTVDNQADARALADRFIAHSGRIKQREDQTYKEKQSRKADRLAGGEGVVARRRARQRGERAA